MQLRQGNDNNFYAESLEVCSEAAVLYSAGYADAAIAMLEGEVQAGSREPRLWIMLFELHRGTQQRVRFDLLLEHYESVFGGAAPCSWGYPPPIAAPGTLPLKGVIGARSLALGLLAEHGNGRKTLAVDMSEVEKIEYACLPAFTGLLRDYAAAGKRVILANVGELNGTLLETVGIGRQVVLMRRRGDRPAPSRSDSQYRMLQAA